MSKLIFQFNGVFNKQPTIEAAFASQFDSRCLEYIFKCFRCDKLDEYFVEIMANLESMIVEEKPPPPKQVDRERTCPLLLRVFCSTGRHHSLAEYAHGSVPANELQIYTWQDATLSELTSLVREVNPDTRKKGTYFDFAIVRPEPRNNQYRMREIGVTCSGMKGADDSKTLAQCNFCIGDYMDINITPPNRLPPPMRRPRPY